MVCEIPILEGLLAEWRVCIGSHAVEQHNGQAETFDAPLTVKVEITTCVLACVTPAARGTCYATLRQTAERGVAWRKRALGTRFGSNPKKPFRLAHTSDPAAWSMFIFAKVPI